MKQGIFDKAVVKLTLIYTGILAVICLGFSCVFWLTTDHELNRPFYPKTEVVQTEISDDSINIILRQKNEQTRFGLFINLMVINASVLILGAVASYFLAKWTLDPIEKMTEQQSQFISNASHELRTPLTALAMENEVTLRDKTMTKNDLVDVIESNLEETKKLQKLTNYLLKLGQDGDIKLSEIAVKKIAQNAIERNESFASAKKIKIENNIKAFKLKANSEALENILATLIENAIKYSPEKTTIKIGAKNGKVFVADEGSGIAPEDLPHIFERFYRAEKSRTTDGYGLGLSLAQQLAEQMNLKIEAKNNKSKGSTFLIG